MRFLSFVLLVLVTVSCKTTNTSSVDSFANQDLWKNYEQGLREYLSFLTKHTYDEFICTQKAEDSSFLINGVNLGDESNPFICNDKNIAEGHNKLHKTTSLLALPFAELLPELKDEGNLKDAAVFVTKLTQMRIFANRAHTIVRKIINSLSDADKQKLADHIVYASILTDYNNLELGKAFLNSHKDPLIKNTLSNRKDDKIRLMSSEILTVVSADYLKDLLPSSLLKDSMQKLKTESYIVTLDEDSRTLEKSDLSAETSENIFRLYQVSLSQYYAPELFKRSFLSLPQQSKDYLINTKPPLKGNAFHVLSLLVESFLTENVWSLLSKSWKDKVNYVEQTMLLHNGVANAEAPPLFVTRNAKNSEKVIDVICGRTKASETSKHFIKSSFVSLHILNQILRRTQDFLLSYFNSTDISDINKRLFNAFIFYPDGIEDTKLTCGDEVFNFDVAYDAGNSGPYRLTATSAKNKYDL